MRICICGNLGRLESRDGDVHWVGEIGLAEEAGAAEDYDLLRHIRVKPGVLQMYNLSSMSSELSSLMSGFLQAYRR